MNMQVLEARRDVSGGYKVDVSRGQRIGRVSSEWYSRPHDERFLSLGELAGAVRGRAERSRTRVVETALIHVEANRSDPERLSLILPGAEAPVVPTHWSFGQLAAQVGAPAAYLRNLPAALAGINLQYGLTSNRAEQIKTLETDDGRVELRAVTGPDYGRIYDYELVEAVQRIAGDGTGDTRWKVPGVLDWSTGIYNPRVDITKDTTTLYASDRDVFLFLVDDLNPIEAGKLPDGSPDLFFRGFYCWNSEVGAKTLGMASFYLRAVCQNRNLWGVEDFEEISIRHSKYAASRFAHEAAPALMNFANSSPMPFVNGNLVAMRTKDGVASLSDLVRSSLRLRPDRIPVGEVRGAEALDLLKAWGTGHPGGIGTIHAGSAIGALRRMEQLIQEAVVTVPRALIAETIDLVAVLSGRGSARRLSELARVEGLGPDSDSRR